MAGSWGRRAAWVRVLRIPVETALWAAAFVLLLVAVVPWLAGLSWSESSRAWLSVVENLRLPVGLSAALVALTALLLRRGRLAAVAGFAIAVSTAPVLANIQGRPPVAADTATVSVMTFNVWVRNREPERLVAYLRREKPDIVLLEEVTEPFKQALAALSDLYPTRITCHSGIVACETVLLSRFPAKRRAAGPIGGGLPSTALAELDLGGRRLTAIAVHVAWPFPMQGRDAQREQLMHLAAALKAFDGPLLIGGDFNGGGWVRNQRDLRAQTGLVGEPGLHPSWPAIPIRGLVVPDWLRLPIDHVFSRGGPIVTAAELGPELGSYHLPLLATLSWPKQSDRARP
jgi:endonuclease/exonuclease/phosphatase (EEP) superfamily protein YafD